MKCALCHGDVDPSDRYTLRQMVGWERRAVGDSRRGGSDITLREATGELAHSHCVERRKQGVPAQQGALIV